MSNTIVFNIPPVRAFRGGASWRDVHDHVAHRKEWTRSQRLGEEIRQLSHAGHEWYSDIMFFDAFPHKEMSAVNVFRPLMVF
eukprot:6214155-Pleurochrysis_carterae.AAC.4